MIRHLTAALVALLGEKLREEIEAQRDHGDAMERLAEKLLKGIARAHGLLRKMIAERRRVRAELNAATARAEKAEAELAKLYSERPAP